MGIGIKRLFKKKKDYNSINNKSIDQGTSDETPIKEANTVPITPSTTEGIVDNDGSPLNDDGDDEYEEQGLLPVVQKILLDDLSVHEQKSDVDETKPASSAFESVFKDLNIRLEGGAPAVDAEATKPEGTTMSTTTTTTTTAAATTNLDVVPKSENSSSVVITEDSEIKSIDNTQPIATTSPVKIFASNDPELDDILSGSDEMDTVDISKDSQPPQTTLQEEISNHMTCIHSNTDKKGLVVLEEEAEAGPSSSPNDGGSEDMNGLDSIEIVEGTEADLGNPSFVLSMPEDEKKEDEEARFNQDGTQQAPIIDAENSVGNVGQESSSTTNVVVGGGPEGEDEGEEAGTLENFSCTLFDIVQRAQQCVADVVMIPDAMQCTGEMMMIPEPVRKLMPTADNACIPVINGGRPRSKDSNRNQPLVVRQYSFYEEKFALKMLDELTNVGYALVHHNLLGADDEVEQGNWIGGSVTMILRPGICNRLQVQAPYLEWVTMGGGQNNVVESTTLSLLDIDSVATSKAADTDLPVDGELGNTEKDITALDNPDEKEDLDCLFSMTTKQGQIYVMEAITADESQRLVAGVKNLVCRLSRQLIAGDENVLTDFFDNAQEPDDIRLSMDEAMLRVSHALLDHMSRA